MIGRSPRSREWPQTPASTCWYRQDASLRPGATAPVKLHSRGFLAGCRELPLDSSTARKAGAILAAAGSSDVIDASVAAAASPNDVVLTGDPNDIIALLDASPAAGARVEILR